MTSIIIPAHHQSAPKHAPEPPRLTDVSTRDYVFRPDQLDADANLVVWAKDCAAILGSKLPGWAWCVGVNVRGRMLSVSSALIDNEWRYHINLVRTPIEDAGVRRRVIIRAAGEYLERYGIPARPYRKEYLANCHRRFGVPSPIIHDKHRSLQRLMRDEEFDAAIREGRIDLRVEDRGGQRHIWVR